MRMGVCKSIPQTPVLWRQNSAMHSTWVPGGLTSSVTQALLSFPLSLSVFLSFPLASWDHLPNELHPSPSFRLCFQRNTNEEMHRMNDSDVVLARPACIYGSLPYGLVQLWHSLEYSSSNFELITKRENWKFKNILVLHIFPCIDGILLYIHLCNQLD